MAYEGGSGGGDGMKLQNEADVGAGGVNTVRGMTR